MSATVSAATMVFAPEPDRRVVFYIPGGCKPKGSHVAAVTKDGRPYSRDMSSSTARSWVALAKDRAHAARGERPMFDQAVSVTMTVLRVRPGSHYGSGKNARVLKATAPTYPTSAPDLDKQARQLGDALNGVLWRDDAQISSWRVVRRWGTEAGITVIVQPEFEP